MGRTGPASMQVIPTQTNGLFGVVARDDDFDTRAKTFTIDLNTADTIDLNVRMADGVVGRISIKGSTIAQIIMDRNSKQIEKDRQETASTEIQVGEGDGYSKSVAESTTVGSEEILDASRRLNNNKQSPY